MDMSSTGQSNACPQSPLLTFRECFVALLLFLILPLAYSAGQEKIAFNYPHDDYNLHGNHLAYIREYLYPLFICLARTLGLGLHNTEVICFGLALFWLWRETISFSKSR